MKPLRVAFCWFSYGLDAAALRVSVESVLATVKPTDDVRLWVVADGTETAPQFSQADVDWLLTRGVEVEWSGFPRRSRMNGVECIRGMLRHELDAARRGGFGGDDVVVKIDSDTLALRPEGLLRAFRVEARIKAAGVQWSPADTGWSGAAYSYRVEALEWLQEHFAAPKSERLYGIGCPEDKAQALAWHRNRPVGSWRTWRRSAATGCRLETFPHKLQETPEIDAQWAARWDFLTCGQREGLARFGDAAAQRAHAARRMAGILRAHLGGSNGA